MSNKKRINLTFDKELWYALDLKCKGSKSKLLEDLAREYVFSSDNIQELRDEISQQELELQTKKKVLNELVKMQEENDKNKELRNKAILTINKILSNQSNTIGQNQIKSIAQINGLTPDKLINKVKQMENIKVEVIYEPPEN